MKISILLPYKENYSKIYAGAVSIFVNSTKKFQKFLGVGGSFTDASAEVFSKLDNAKQEEFLTVELLSIKISRVR